MLVWSVASQKGGVGKTTTVASLAGWMQKEHLRALVVDTDPHASLTSYLGFEDANLDHNLYDLYATQELDRDLVLNSITHTNFQGLDLISSTMTLATIDRQLSGRVGVGRILSNALSLIDDCYDIVIIDCPPVLGALMVNALFASTLVLVPTQTEFLALKGLEGMIRTFKIMNQVDSKEKIDYLVIPTMFDRRTKASLQSLDFLHQNYAQKVWESCIPIDTRFRESSARRTPLPLMDTNSRGSLAYRDLFTKLVEYELATHANLVTPATAAILMNDEEQYIPKSPMTPKKEQQNIADQSVAQMVSSAMRGEH